MNGDEFQGASRHLRGRAQTALGGVTGDPARQVRGAVNQVAGGAQSAYGRARARAEDWAGALAEDGGDRAHAIRDRAGALVDEGRDAAREAGRHGRRALRYADDNRTSALLGLAAIAFAVGWLAKPKR